MKQTQPFRIRVEMVQIPFSKVKSKKTQSKILSPQQMQMMKIQQLGSLALGNKKKIGGI